MMQNSPITLSSKKDNHLITLATVLEDEFRRIYGEPISVNKILFNQTFRKLLEDNRYVEKEQEDKEWVCRFLQDVITNNQKFNTLYYIERSKKFVQEYLFDICRRCKHRVKNAQDLERLINAHPGGLEINQELLRYSYRKIEEDLKRLHKENTFRRLGKEKGDNYYMVFPTIEEKDMEIFQPKFEDFDCNWYLEQCAKINAFANNKNEAEVGRKTRQSKKSHPDPNYYLEGYAEMKEEWEKRNAKK